MGLDPLIEVELLEIFETLFSQTGLGLVLQVVSVEEVEQLFDELGELGEIRPALAESDKEVFALLSLLGVGDQILDDVSLDDRLVIFVHALVVVLLITLVQQDFVILLELLHVGDLVRLASQVGKHLVDVLPLDDGDVFLEIGVFFVGCHLDFVRYLLLIYKHSH